MRAIFILFLIVAVLGWFGFELRKRRPDLSVVLFVAAGIVAGFLALAFFGAFD
jgi:hypothetical protein